jgi:phage terminase large subunit GpA-like protein
MSVRKSAIALMAAAMVAVLEPPVRQEAWAWASENLVVPDGPQAGTLMDLELTPYLREPMEFASFDSVENEVAIRKSAQTGFTLFLLASASHMIVHDPCNAMIVQPTQSALGDFEREKLARVIDETEALFKKVKAQVSRSGRGSTSSSKQYPGGSLKLAISSSAADLRSKTVKWAGCDEVDEYPVDLDGQGSPLDMVEARQESFLMSGEWKRLYISTPTILKASEINVRFEAGDQRYWHMPCPGCGEKFHFKFDLACFRFNEVFPYEAHYVTPCCGQIIEGHEKVALMKKGEWIATAARPGAYPSYHFDALTSPFVPWDKIAERYLKARENPTKMKSFTNLTLGLPYEVTSDAPDHDQLFLRRDRDMPSYQVPKGGVILIGSADVQGNGIYVLLKAYGPNAVTYTVDADFLEGDTSVPGAGAWLKLDQYCRREFKYEMGGRARPVRFGVDSGYRSHVVYTWCRDRRDFAMALKGADGWNLPALGAPKLVDIALNGKRIRKGAQLYTVGTYPLKAAHYDRLRKVMNDDGSFPPGYVHFSWGLSEEYFKQITGEFLSEETYRGRPRLVWKPVPGKENHWLDCNIYCDAISEYLGVSRLENDDWAGVAQDLGVGFEQQILDDGLFTPEVARRAASKPAGNEVPEKTPQSTKPRRSRTDRGLSRRGGLGKRNGL